MLGAKLDYVRQTENIAKKIGSMGIAHELAQLEVNKEDLGVVDIHFEPAFGLILIKMDLKNLNIDSKHASFIDLDVNKTLNFEIKFHVQRITLNTDGFEDLTHKRLHKEDYYKNMIWYQRRDSRSDEENKDIV